MSHAPTVLPGHVGIESDSRVTEQIGQPLGHQNPDLLNWAAQLQDAHIETWLGPLNAVSMERELLLEKSNNISVILDFIHSFKSPSNQSAVLFRAPVKSLSFPV